MRWAIRLYSKHTGDAITLGIKHETREAAEAYAAKEVCSRCNGVSFFPVEDDDVWANKVDGFVSKDWWNKQRRERRWTP